MAHAATWMGPGELPLSEVDWTWHRRQSVLQRLPKAAGISKFFWSEQRQEDRHWRKGTQDCIVQFLFWGEGVLEMGSGDG